MQFVTASLGNVVTGKKLYIFKKKHVIRPENAQTRERKSKKVIVLCSTWTLNVYFTSGSTKKGQRHSFVSVVPFLLNMNIVSCWWNPENNIAKKKRKKKAIISSYRYVYFHVLY